MAGRARAFRDVVTASLVLVVFALLARTSFRPKRFGDLDFHREAKGWSEAVRGASDWSTVHVGRAPGPVLYYLIPYMTVTPGSSDDAYWAAGFVWTVIWVCAALILIRRVGEELGGSDIGWFGVAFTLLPPLVVYYTFGIGPDVPAFVAVVIFCYGWVTWRRSGAVSLFTASWWMTWLGLSAALLCRPNAILVLPIAAVCAAFSWVSKAEVGRARARAAGAGILLAGTLFTVSTTLVQRLGGWQEGNLAHVVLQGRFQYRTEPWDWRYWGRDYRSGSRDYAAWAALVEELRQRASRSGESLASLEWKWIRNDVADHPGLSLRMAGIRLLAIQVVFANGPGGGEFGLRSGRRLASVSFHVLTNVAYASSVVLALAYLMRRREAVLELWPLWGCWVALLVFHAFTYAEPRYLFPGRAGMAVLATLMMGQMVRSQARPGPGKPA